MLTALLPTTVGMLVVAVQFPTAASVMNGPKPPEPDWWGYAIGVRDSGYPSGSHAHSGPASRGNTNRKATPPPPDVCGNWKFGIQGCNYPDLPSSKAPADSPAQLAAEAWRGIPLPVPKVATAPPRGSDGLVGLPEWFWVTNWSAHSKRAKAGRVWAQVTARPSGLTISPGQGQPVVRCQGPGTAYSRSVPADGQHTDCSYTYRRSSAGLPKEAYRVTVTVRWGGTWQGSGGTGGTLPGLSRSASFTLRVAEGQAVTGG